MHGTLQRRMQLCHVDDTFHLRSDAGLRVARHDVVLMMTLQHGSQCFDDDVIARLETC